MLLTTSYLESINLRKRIKATRNKTTATVVAGRMVLLSLLSKKIKNYMDRFGKAKGNFCPMRQMNSLPKKLM